MFGSSRGLNDENKKLVDSILRDAQTEEPVVQRVVQASQWQQPPMYNQGPRFIPPQFPWHPPNKELGIFVSCLATLLGNAQLREVLNPTFLFLQWNLLDPLKEGEAVEGHLVQL